MHYTIIERPPSVRDDHGWYILMFLFLIFINFLWVVAASLMAEKTNVGVADNTSMCGFRSDGVLSACSLVRCCSLLYNIILIFDTVVKATI